MPSAPNTPSYSSWFPADTGATHHVTPNIANLSLSESYNGNESVRVGNGKSLPIANVGNSLLHTSHKSFKLDNILHVPSITKSLLSVQKFTKDNQVFFEFHPDKFFVKDPTTKNILLQGTTDAGLYRFPPARFVNQCLHQTQFK